MQAKWRPKWPKFPPSNSILPPTQDPQKSKASTSRSSLYLTIQGSERAQEEEDVTNRAGAGPYPPAAPRPAAAAPPGPWRACAPRTSAASPPSSPARETRSEQSRKRRRRETQDRAGRDPACLVGGLDAVHDVEPKHAAEDGPGHETHVRPTPRPRRRHRSPVTDLPPRRLPPPPPPS